MGAEVGIDNQPQKLNHIDTQKLCCSYQKHHFANLRRVVNQPETKNIINIATLDKKQHFVFHIFVTRRCLINHLEPSGHHTSLSQWSRDSNQQRLITGTSPPPELVSVER